MSTNTRAQAQAVKHSDANSAAEPVSNTKKPKKKQQSNILCDGKTEAQSRNSHSVKSKLQSLILNCVSTETWLTEIIITNQEITPDGSTETTEGHVVGE